MIRYKKLKPGIFVTIKKEDGTIVNGTISHEHAINIVRQVVFDEDFIEELKNNIFEGYI